MPNRLCSFVHDLLRHPLLATPPTPAAASSASELATPLLALQSLLHTLPHPPPSTYTTLARTSANPTPLPLVFPRHRRNHHENSLASRSPLTRLEDSAQMVQLIRGARRRSAREMGGKGSRETRRELESLRFLRTLCIINRSMNRNSGAGMGRTTRWICCRDEESCSPERPDSSTEEWKSISSSRVSTYGYCR